MVEPSKIIFLIQNTIPQKEDRIFLYTVVYSGLYRDNEKENGNYYNGLYRDYRVYIRVI